MLKVSKVRKRKAEVLQFLQSRDLDAIAAWAEKNESSLRILFNLTFHDDDLTRWRAIEALGKAARVIAAADMEKVRTFIRGLIWQMTDESGAIGWHAPEAIAEILYNIPALMKEYARLLPQYMIEEPFERGAFFAVARLSSLEPGLVDQSAAILLDSLDHPDAAIRGYTIIALGVLKTDFYTAHIKKLIHDEAVFTTYDFQTGKLTQKTVGGLAKKQLGA